MPKRVVGGLLACVSLAPVIALIFLRMTTSNTSYPSGSPGMALALLRLSIAGTLAVLSVDYDGASSSLSIISALLACLIAGGFLTRLAASIFAAASLLSIVLHDVSLFYAPIAIEGLALAILGPGGWSVDAFNTNRRLVMAQDRTDNDL